MIHQLTTYVKRLVCFIWGIFFSILAQATETVTTGDLYPPYVDQSLPGQGLMVPIIERILDKTEDYFDIEMVYQPWVRGYEQAREGIHLGTFPYVWDKMRGQHFYYSDPVFDISSYLFVRDELEEKEWTIELLQEKGWSRVCRPHGYSIEELREPFLSRGSFDVYSPSDLPDCFRLLERGRIDIVPIERITGEFTLLNHMRGFKVKRFDNPIFDAGLHFIVSKQRGDGAEVIRQFNKALKEVKASGELARWQQDFFDRVALDMQ